MLSFVYVSVLKSVKVREFNFCIWETGEGLLPVPARLSNEELEKGSNLQKSSVQSYQKVSFLPVAYGISCCKKRFSILAKAHIQSR